jgi:hypothetical protein
VLSAVHLRARVLRRRRVDEQAAVQTDPLRALRPGRFQRAPLALSRGKRCSVPVATTTDLAAVDTTSRRASAQSESQERAALNAVARAT